MLQEDRDSFVHRHIGPRDHELRHMLDTVGAKSLEELVDQTVPAKIRLEKDLNISAAMSEQEYIEHIQSVASRNQVWKNYIGQGYSDCFTPPVIQRTIFENPGWYTQYTPYQAEISQGRLEALLNFQTMVMDLTAMDIANASLLDEGTAAAEAMGMLHRMRSPAQEKANADVFFVSNDCHPQTIAVLQGRAEPLGITLEFGDATHWSGHDRCFGALIQYPNTYGALFDYSDWAANLRERGIRLAVATDLLALALLTPPGEFGADVVLGNSQRFGVPPGFGGPHAAFFATRDEFKRSMPGRLIGVSRDSHGAPAYRLALQTREQHIRREKATSNICTAQALLAIMAGMYAVYHGPEGLRRIARGVHRAACRLEAGLQTLGFSQKNEHFFDTLCLEMTPALVSAVREAAQKARVNLRYFPDGSHVGIALDETTTETDLEAILEIFANAKGATTPALASGEPLRFGEQFRRSSVFLNHEVFHRHRSETEMMRYIRQLEGRDLALNQAMIPLGSCTMKLNPAVTMMPVSMPAFARAHPFTPIEQLSGYAGIFRELEQDLAEITGLAATSLQPNSGAQGEYAGLMVIRAYHRSRGDEGRDVALIPASAHGTNPASAAMAGMRVVVVACDSNGNIDLEDLRARAEKHKDHLAALMVTYPSTHGVFEEGILEVCRIVHDCGGQVYMDGANMNAQVGLTSPGRIGADVCHLNLHKTFSIPHGGGGPGMGPICVAAHLEPFLPSTPLSEKSDSEIQPISAAPWGSASILLISYGYIKLLGAGGLKAATQYAILNANYLKRRLENAYRVLYAGPGGRIAHEMILDMRPFKDAGVEVEDVAKRLIDYGFHAPTMSFPVPGTLMVEPTESEPLSELQRFCEAMLKIRREIEQVEQARITIEESPLRRAPHTAASLCEDWARAYERTEAVFPLANQVSVKFWPPVGRIDNVYGDRNLVCACPPMEAYAETDEAPTNRETVGSAAR